MSWQELRAEIAAVESPSDLPRPVVELLIRIASQIDADAERPPTPLEDLRWTRNRLRSAAEATEDPELLLSLLREYRQVVRQVHLVEKDELARAEAPSGKLAALADGNWDDDSS